MNRVLVIKSLIYKYVERFAAKALGFIISILLARLLAPEAFGQVAIITVFVNLSLCIIEGGLATALVQNETADDTDYSTVFFICMAMSLLLTLLMFAAAPVIAGFYKSPEILWPLRVYAFSVFFSSYGAVLTAKIQREMRFRQMMICSLTATVLAGILAVVLGFLGAGIWTLVVYYFAYIVFSCLAMALAVRWVPKLRFSVGRAKELYSFGWKMLVSSLMKSLYLDLRPLIIGKHFSTADLGYYDRGSQVPFVITNALDSSMSSVMLPVMSRAQSDREALKGILRRSITMNAMLVFPAMAGLAVIAEPFVRVMLTDKWLPSVPYMQILCIAHASIALTTPNGLSISAMGRSDVYMKMEFLRRSIMLIQLILTVVIFDSVVAMAYSYAISVWLDAVISAIPNRHFLGYGFLQQARDLWKIIAASALMALAAWAVGLLPMHPALEMLVQIVTGAMVYIIICLALKVETFHYALNLIRKKGKT